MHIRCLKASHSVDKWTHQQTNIFVISVVLQKRGFTETNRWFSRQTDSSADSHFCDFSGTSEKGIYKETNQSFSTQMDSSADFNIFFSGISGGFTKRQAKNEEASVVRMASLYMSFISSS